MIKHQFSLIYLFISRQVIPENGTYVLHFFADFCISDVNPLTIGTEYTLHIIAKYMAVYCRLRVKLCCKVTGKVFCQWSSSWPVS